MQLTLPPRQSAVFQAVVSYWDARGVGPSMADLARQLGISRPTIHEHLHTLKRKGHLQHIEGQARSWRPVHSQVGVDQPSRIPLIGWVSAGLPVMAAENIEDWLLYDDARSGEILFALRINGNSMVGAGILDGDCIVVRQQSTAREGEIIVALVDEEDATVKTFGKEGDQIALIAQNPNYPPIVVSPERVRVLGRVVAVRRNLRTPDY